MTQHQSSGWFPQQQLQTLLGVSVGVTSGCALGLATLELYNAHCYVLQWQRCAFWPSTKIALNLVLPTVANGTATPETTVLREGSTELFLSMNALWQSVRYSTVLKRFCLHIHTFKHKAAQLTSTCKHLTITQKNIYMLGMTCYQTGMSSIKHYQVWPVLDSMGQTWIPYYSHKSHTWSYLPHTSLIPDDIPVQSWSYSQLHLIRQSGCKHLRIMRHCM